MALPTFETMPWSSLWSPLSLEPVSLIFLIHWFNRAVWDGLTVSDSPANTDRSAIIIIIIIIFNWLRQAAQPYTWYYTTYNSLPCRAAMTRHRLSRRTATTTRFSPKGIGCQKQTAPRFCQHPIRWAFSSQALTRWRHQHIRLHTPAKQCKCYARPTVQ